MERNPTYCDTKTLLFQILFPVIIAEYLDVDHVIKSSLGYLTLMEKPGEGWFCHFALP